MGNEEKPQKDHLGNAKISWLGHIKISSSQLKWGIAAIAVVIIGFIIWSSFNGSRPKSANAGEITITALQQNENGVKRESSFLLTCENPINMSVVKSSLQIAPALGYDIKEKDSKSFEIVPQEKLAANTVYKFAFDPSNKAQESLSWAFQTIGSFTLLGTMPRTETVGVPVDTGIEFTFSQEDFDLNQAIKYITITPKTEGRFEKHKQTLVFIPQSLQPATLYTVTLKKGLPQKDGRESIVENHILRFETNSTTATEHEFIFDLENRLTEFNTKQTPTFPVSFGTGATVPHSQVDIYRYPDADSFGQAMNSIAKIPYWCSYADSKFRQDASKFTRVLSYDTVFKPASKYKYFIALPAPMPAGYYLMEIKAGPQTRQAIFQVSDLAVYRAQSQKKSLLWVNDVAIKAPAEKVQVWVNKQKLAILGDDRGVVLLDENSTWDQAGYALLKSGAKELVIPLDREFKSLSQGFDTRQNYWKYLYLDRELYLPGDTVHYWGVMTPRGKNVMPETNLTMELWGGDYYYSEQHTSTPLISQSLKLQGNTFAGKLHLPMLKPGYYYLELKLGKVALVSRGFSVETYQKPAYQLTVKPNRKAILAGEQVNYAIKSTFFEGTAVPNLNLKYYVNGKEGQVTTNLQGEATVPYTGSYAADNFAPFNYEYFNANTSQPESGDIGDYNGVLVFPSAVNVRAEAKSKGDSFSLTTRLNRVDLTQVDAGGYVSEDNYLKTPIAGGQIKGRLYKEVWTRTKTGETYDYINKKVLPIYDYEFNTQLVGNIDLTTNQQGVAEYTGTLDKGYSYYIELTSPDEKGREGRARVYVGEFYDDNYSYKYYSLKDPQRESYQPGDKVNLNMMLNTQQLAPQGNPVLFFQGQTDITSYQVSQQSSYEFVFREADIPNTNVYGVYFDGETYQESGGYAVGFDRQSRELKIIVQPDKKEYRPGDTVRLSVLVKDKLQKPVKNAHLNLNLVDEALYKLMDQRVDLLGNLYGEYLNPVLSTWKSHYHPQLSGGAEQGGEGSGERRDFRDTVLFANLVTDAEGRSLVQFKLPDNLTSWRITYHALTADLMAGSGTSQLPVRLPFFVNLTTSQTYRTGDAPVVTLNSYGSQLQAAASVKYQMTLTNPQGEKSVYNRTGRAFAALDWQLPSLQPGKYTLKVTARSGKYQDTLVQSFQTYSSFIERHLVEQKLLKAGLVVSGSKVQPTTLVFSDYEKNQYLEGLYNLSWLYGSRVEHRVASQEARKLLQQYFQNTKNWQIDRLTNSSLLNYQQVDGGISILPHAASDLAVSARIAAMSPGSFDPRALSGYFYRLLDEGKDQDKSLIYLGLASLNEPVLLPIKQALEQDNLNPAQRINLSLALLELGDGAYATQVYQELIGKYSQDLGTTLRIKVGRDQDEIIAATTQMAVLASRLNQPEKQRLLAYLQQNPGEEIVNSLEILQILKYDLRYMDTEPVSFTYELKGKAFSHALKGNETLQLTVLPQDLPTLKFNQIKGKVGLMVYYSAPVPSKAGINEDLAIKRTYLVNQKPALTLATSTKRSKDSLPVVVMLRSDLVRIEINTTAINRAPGGSYEVIDVLPAGLAYLSRVYSPAVENSSYPDWPTEVNGQQLTFVVAKGQSKIVYYARVIAPGKYTAEAPLLQHCQNHQVFIRGAEQELIIR